MNWKEFENEEKHSDFMDLLQEAANSRDFTVNIDFVYFRI